MTPDGVAGPDTVEEINVQADTRLAQILVAMERERWMNYEGGLGERHIWVNLTDFRTKVYDHGKVTFETKSVVGERRDGKHTPEFSDEMEYMELNPDWTVPRSILARDYLPQIPGEPERGGLPPADRLPRPRGRPLPDRLHAVHRVELPLHGAPAAGRPERARTREVHVPEPARDLPPRHAREGALRP